MKKIQKEKEEDFIKRGMRAVTFPIDQRSASATTMLKAGDLVDVLIMEQRGERTKTYKYKALKILAIDGVTKFDSTANKSQEDNGFLSNVVNVSGLMTPKNVTLEVPENLVETLLRQASSNGIILSLRSQLEKVTDTDNSNIGTATNDEFDYMLQNILDINDNDPSTIQLKEDAERKKDDDNMKMVIDNILLMNSNDEGSSFGSSNNLSGQYEIISGKVVGDDFDDSDEKTATVYRKLTPTKVEFDEYGKVSTGEKNSGN
ncbi:MAG: hypothetical protein IJ730_03465 [Alphaproteobacteria bacterium]|nr:hypothetical protein [Alphaproteobacteria bacterium]